MQHSGNQPVINIQVKKTLLVLMFSCVVLSFNAQSQARNYSLLYSDNIRGGATIFGNTLMNITNANGVVNLTSMNDNSATGNGSAGNGFSNMQPVDIDGNTGVAAGTKNSSSANLVLPAGTNTIKIARLYWGGRNVIDTNNLALPANRTIKIRKGTSGAYTEFAALQLDTIPKEDVDLGHYQLYQAYVDITAFIQQQGAGTYTVGNIPVVRGDGGGIGNFGGWSITVVYENSALDFNSIRVYDGFTEVFNGGSPLSRIVTLTGLDVPSGALSLPDARLSVVTWEGDANISNDYFKINGNTFSNAKNPSTNPWNGTITNDGVHVTTKNPNYTNQMGIDIDQFNVGTGFGILPNATSVQLEFGTEQDVYLPSIFAFVIKMKQPTITLGKTVTDANNNNSPEPGEILTYTLKGKNLGPGNANSVIVTDTLPSTITYVPNSIRVNYCPGVVTGLLTDAAGDDNGEYVVNGTTKSIQLRMGNGSNGTVGGTLAALDSFEVIFKATVNTPLNGQSVPPIINIARIKALSQSLVTYVDDGIAILNPSGGPVPIILQSFEAHLLNNNLVNVNWKTAMEINSKKYEVERSTDRRHFSSVATISGAGNSSSVRSYTINDDVASVTSSILYYRLKQTDFDNAITYSKVVAVRLKKGTSEITVAPNPFHQYVNVAIEAAGSELAAVKVYTMLGKEVISKNVLLVKGTNTVMLEELTTLPAGAYLLKCVTGERVLNVQLVKE